MTTDAGTPRTYRYAAVLNDLHEMQLAFVYATRKGTLNQAEHAIVSLEDAFTAAEAERDAAVAWIGCVRDELVIAGCPPGDRTVALAHLRKVLAERDALRQAMSFTQGAIEDAIYTEDGLDGETGERVLHIIQEAIERGTFDKTQIGGLPRPMLETENDALRARVAGLRNLVEATDRLCDEAGAHVRYMRALAEARALLAPSSEETK